MGVEKNLDEHMADLYARLKSDFPPQAYSVDKSRGFALTSLKAQYLVERLNDVLGIHGWEIKGEFKPTENGGMSYIGQLYVKVNGEIIHTVEAIGYSDSKKNVGDVLKSARTDALSKAASYLGVGNEMFKGNIEPGKGTNTNATTTTSNYVSSSTKSPKSSGSKSSSSGFTKPSKEPVVENGGAEDGWE